MKHVEIYTSISYDNRCQDISKSAINQLYLSINYPVVYDIGRIVTV